jgi:hypothetical protein
MSHSSLRLCGTDTRVLYHSGQVEMEGEKRRGRVRKGEGKRRERQGGRERKEREKRGAHTSLLHAAPTPHV